MIGLCMKPVDFTRLQEVDTHPYFLLLQWAIIATTLLNDLVEHKNGEMANIRTGQV